MEESDNFESIPREERNMLLKKLLEGNGIIVFPSDDYHPADGLP